MRDETCALRCIRHEYTVQSTQYTVHSWSILVLCCGTQTSSRWSSVRARRCATCSPSRTRTPSASSARAMQSPRQRPASSSRGTHSACSSSRGASCPSSSISANNSSSTLRCASALDECASSSASYTSLFSLAIYENFALPFMKCFQIEQSPHMNAGFSLFAMAFKKLELHVQYQLSSLILTDAPV